MIMKFNEHLLSKPITDLHNTWVSGVSGVSLSLSVCLSVSLCGSLCLYCLFYTVSLTLSVSVSFTLSLSRPLSTCLSVCLICLSPSLSVCLSVSLSVSLSHIWSLCLPSQPSLPTVSLFHNLSASLLITVSNGGLQVGTLLCLNICSRMPTRTA